MLAILPVSVFFVLTTASVPNRHVLEEAKASLHFTFPGGLTKDAKTALRGTLLDGLEFDVHPTAYALTLTFEEILGNKPSFTGRVAINLTVTKNRPIRSFSIHAVGLEFDSVVMGNDKLKMKCAHRSVDRRKEIVSIQPAQALHVGDYWLLIDYRGYLNVTDMVGLFKGIYFEKGKEYRFVASQFDGKYARRAFPCFDEPALKATFNITIVCPVRYNARSNAVEGSTEIIENGALKKVTFLKTPKMSTYLVAIFIFEEDCKRGANFNDVVEIELCPALPMYKKSLQMALDATPKILQYMSSFTKHTYDDVKKVTLAAIPDFVSGAMENWGLITVRDGYLLWHEHESTFMDKQLSLTILAQELAHQWFGNLVTPEWWNDLYLSRGIANFFSYYAADFVQPAWQLQKQFVLDVLQPALYDDTFICIGYYSLPLSIHLEAKKYTALEPDTFDVLQGKGASIIRMVQHFLGFENFQAGIIEYIKRYKTKFATNWKFWNSFQSFPSQFPDVSLSEVMYTWVHEPNFPQINVLARGDTIIIRQTEFHLPRATSGPDKRVQWYVPITYSTSAEEAQDTSTKVWVTPRGSPEVHIEGLSKNGSYVVLNNQRVGFYRVDYDKTLLSKISAALAANISNIDEISRATLIDDQFGIARISVKSFDDVFKFITFLKYDDSYYSWSAAFNGFSFLLERTFQEGIREHITSFIKEHMETLNKSVNSLEMPFDHVSTLKQAMLLTWRCRLNEESCITDAVNRLDGFRDCVNVRPPPHLRSIVYCYGLRHSSRRHYYFLKAEYQTTKIPTERLTILEALACTANPNDRQNLLVWAFHTRELLEFHDVLNILLPRFLDNPDGVTTLINYLRDNYESVVKLNGIANFKTVIKILGVRLTTQDHVDLLRNFANTAGIDRDAAEILNTFYNHGKDHLLGRIQKIEEDFKAYKKNWLTKLF